MTCCKAIIFSLPILLTIPALVFAEESVSERNSRELSALDQRIKIERTTRLQPFVMTQDKPNYILPVSYNSNPNNASLGASRNGDLDKTEVKFQFSMKYPLIDNLFDGQGSLQFAYTHLSFWQAYNKNFSVPIRETAHEPEIF
jgi:phospholipase A1